jgi:hypothetical protein
MENVVYVVIESMDLETMKDIMVNTLRMESSIIFLQAQTARRSEMWSMCFAVGLDLWKSLELKRG